jgi:predicted metal-binding membrane protein
MTHETSLSVAHQFVRLISIALVTAVVLLAWWFVVWSTTNMDHPIVMLMMPISAGWHPFTIAAVFAMWSIMMAAMMLPAALPVLDAYHRIVVANAPHGAVAGGVFYFAAGHLFIWIAFAATATLAQWLLVGSDVIEPMMIELRNPFVAGGVLVAAGIFQWTPLKDACLSRCRAPIGFLLTEWRSGRSGALVMGLRYGLFCVGCCWALMALMFVFGAMNLLAIIVLTGIVIIEKIVPQGEWVARFIGAALVLFGIYWIVSA